MLLFIYVLCCRCDSLSWRALIDIIRENMVKIMLKCAKNVHHDGDRSPALKRRVLVLVLVLVCCIVHAMPLSCRSRQSRPILKYVVKFG